MKKNSKSHHFSNTQWMHRWPRKCPNSKPLRFWQRPKTGSEAACASHPDESTPTAGQLCSIPLEKSQSALASCPFKKKDTDKVSQHVPQIYFKTGGISPLVVLRKYI